MLAIIVLGAWGSPALAGPSLEDLVGQALEGHPSVLASRARLAVAQAEVDAAELGVTCQMTALRADLTTAEQAVEEAHKQQEAAQQTLKSGGDLKDLVGAEAKAKEAKAAVEAAEANLARANAVIEQIQGAFGRAASRVAKPAPEVEQQMPTDAAVRRILEALAKPVDVEMADMTLPEAVKMLRESAKAPISHDAARDLNDVKVSVSLKATKLGAALQAIEDQGQDIVFVVREYGILATRKDHAKEHGFVPAVQLWREKGDDKTEEKGDDAAKEAPKDAPKDVAPAAPAPAPAAPAAPAQQ
jgi:hypothetical protein